jgi:4-azaleucine resistance transporter AzlC
MDLSGFKKGVEKAVPIGFGYFPLGLAFGVIAQAAGLSTLEVGVMSILVFSGSGQYIAVGLLTLGTGFWALVATIMLVNSRYVLFSATISRYVKPFPHWLSALICQELTDETFVVSTAYFQDHPVDRSFWLGLNLTSHFVWISSTVLGAAVGNFLPDLESLGFNFALPAMFIALFFMTASNKKAILVGCFAGILSVLLYHIGFTGTNVIWSTVIGATAGVMMQKWIQE